MGAGTHVCMRFFFPVCTLFFSQPSRDKLVQVRKNAAINSCAHTNVSDDRMERGTRDLPGLVQEYVLPQDGGTLPESIRTKGFATLDALEQSVLSAFPGGGDTPLEGEELEAIFERLGLIAFKQEVTSGVASRFRTVGQFVSGVAECVKLNPILVTLAAEFGSCPSEDLQLPLASAQRDAEVRYAVLLCFLYHSFADLAMDAPMGEQTLFARLVARVVALKDSVEWQPYFNLFEKAKLLSIHTPVDTWLLPLKMGTYTEDGEEEGTGWGTTINIMEAVYQDASWGNEYNSACGFELMLEPPGRGSIEGLLACPPVHQCTAHTHTHTHVHAHAHIQRETDTRAR